MAGIGSPPAPRSEPSWWRSRGVAAWALWPLSLIYRLLVSLRRTAYRFGWLASTHPGVPVIVVGNVVAGGAGKTPVVIALVAHLQAAGWRPGVVSRGYGRIGRHCQSVQPDTPAREVGDEPALIARRCRIPVFVAPRRVEAALALLSAHPETDILLCDDGLQHLALARDLEICVFNDQGVGNGFLLPAGPLREPWPRPVDWVLHAGPPPATTAARFQVTRALAPEAVRADGTRTPLRALRDTPLHAVAAVARPGDFFAMLRHEGLDLASATALPDHYDFDSYKVNIDVRKGLVCTEKDAVKLWAWAPHAWAVPLHTRIDPAFYAALDQRLASWRAASLSSSTA